MKINEIGPGGRHASHIFKQYKNVNFVNFVYLREILRDDAVLSLILLLSLKNYKSDSYMILLSIVTSSHFISHVYL